MSRHRREIMQVLGGNNLDNAIIVDKNNPQTNLDALQLQPRNANGRQPGESNKENLSPLGESNIKAEIASKKSISNFQKFLRPSTNKLGRQSDESNKEKSRLLNAKDRKTELYAIQKELAVGNDIKETIQFLREKYKSELEEVSTRRSEKTEKIESFEKNEQSLTTKDGYTYERTAHTYHNPTTRLFTTEITIKVKKEGEDPVEITTQYSEGESKIARMCCAKLDGFIQSIYHNAFARAKRKIEYEMAQAKLQVVDETEQAKRKVVDKTEQAKQRIVDETEQAKRRIVDETEQAKQRIVDETEQAKRRIEQKIVPLSAELATTLDSVARTNLDTQQVPAIAALDAQRDQKLSALDAQCNQKLSALDAQCNQKIPALDAQRDQKLSALDAQRDQKFSALDAQRDQKLSEAEQNASAEIIRFLDKYGKKSMDSELFGELQYEQGREAAENERRSEIEEAEDKLNTNAKSLQEITSEINDKIQGIKRIIPSSESNALANSHPLDGHLTLENLEQKIEASMRTPSRGFSDSLLEEISSLANDESKYPESLGPKDKETVHKMLLDIGVLLVARHIKQTEPWERVHEWERYRASHYGKRLMYERQLIDHIKVVAEAASKHSAAVYNESELVKRADILYRGGLRKVNLHPFYLGFNDIDKYTKTTLAKLRNIDNQSAKGLAKRFETTLEQLRNIDNQSAKDLTEHIQTLEELSSRAHNTQGAKDLAESIQITLTELRSTQEAKDLAERFQTTLEQLRSISNTQGAQDLDESIQALEKLRNTNNTPDVKDLNEHIQTLEKLKSIPHIQDAEDLDEHIQTILEKLRSIQKAKDLDGRIQATLEQLRSIPNTQEAPDVEKKLTTDLKNLLKQSPDVYQLNDAQQLQIALDKLEQARLESVATKGEYEKTLALKETIQKLIDQEKAQDDADDALDLKKENSIKETDKITLQQSLSQELEVLKHNLAKQLEDHKAFNREEEELRQFRITLDKLEVGNMMQQERIATMYWLALFGSGDQAALFALGRDSGAEFNAFMSMLR